jgi:hypothetical protein
MSQKYPGGFITKSPVAPSQGIASGMWTLDQAMQLKKQGVWPPTLPGAPTIGTATATGSTTATVVYTAPTGNGGSTITSYTATSSPAGGTGTLSQAGSGTITVTGLSASTSYTFTVTATNAIGTSAASAASNSITTPLPAIGGAFGGGFFAGQISTSGNSVADYNLVVGPKATAESIKKSKTTNTGTAGTNSLIDGPGNTNVMNNANHPAAQFCKGLTIGGFTDWYMPAKNEVEICYYNLKPTSSSNQTSSGVNANAVPARASPYTSGNPAVTSAATFAGGAEAFNSGAGGDSGYWASTQRNPYDKPWIQYFSNGGQYSFNADGDRNVRAVRRVAV